MYILCILIIVNSVPGVFFEAEKILLFVGFLLV